MSLRLQFDLKRKGQPDVLVLKEKHDNRYFDVSTPEKLYAVALHVILDRVDDGYWYYSLDEVFEGSYDAEVEAVENLLQEEQRLVEMSTAHGNKVFADLVQETIKTHVEKLKNFKAAQEDYKAYAKFLDDLKLCQDTKDGKLAWKLLQKRAHYEYEGFELKWFEKIDGSKE